MIKQKGANVAPGSSPNRPTSSEGSQSNVGGEAQDNPDEVGDSPGAKEAAEGAEGPRKCFGQLSILNGEIVDFPEKFPVPTINLEKFQSGEYFLIPNDPSSSFYLTEESKEILNEGGEIAVQDSQENGNEIIINCE